MTISAQVLCDLRNAIANLRECAEGDSNDAEIHAGHDVADAAERLVDELENGS